MAAILAVSVAKSHAFVDGNKRTGFAALDAFLTANGYDLTIEPGDERIARAIEQVVDGSAGEEDLVALLRSVSAPIS